MYDTRETVRNEHEKPGPLTLEIQEPQSRRRSLLHEDEKGHEGNESTLLSLLHRHLHHPFPLTTSPTTNLHDICSYVHRDNAHNDTAFPSREELHTERDPPRRPEKLKNVQDELAIRSAMEHLLVTDHGTDIVVEPPPQGGYFMGPLVNDETDANIGDFVHQSENTPSSPSRFLIETRQQCFCFRYGRWGWLRM